MGLLPRRQLPRFVRRAEYTAVQRGFVPKGREVHNCRQAAGATGQSQAASASVLAQRGIAGRPYLQYTAGVGRRAGTKSCGCLNGSDGSAQQSLRQVLQQAVRLCDGRAWVVLLFAPLDFVEGMRRVCRRPLLFLTLVALSLFASVVPGVCFFLVAAPQND